MYQSYHSTKWPMVPATRLIGRRGRWATTGLFDEPEVSNASDEFVIEHSLGLRCCSVGCCGVCRGWWLWLAAGCEVSGRLESSAVALFGLLWSISSRVSNGPCAGVRQRAQ